MHRHAHWSNHIMYYEYGFTNYQRFNNNKHKNMSPIQGRHWFNMKLQSHYLLVPNAGNIGTHWDPKFRINIPSICSVNKKTSSANTQDIKKLNRIKTHSHMKENGTLYRSHKQVTMTLFPLCTKINMKSIHRSSELHHNNIYNHMIKHLN